MLTNLLQKSRLFGKVNSKIIDYRSKGLIKKFEQYLNKNDAILDVGSGDCRVCEILKEKGYNVAPLDVKNLSCCDKVKPALYDGKKMPFKGNTFNVALILTVLHHTPNPVEIIKEAKRVSKRVIIIEDIYRNKIHKYLTNFLDSLYNLQFIGHPHSNKTDKEWQSLFERLGLEIKDVEHINPLPVFRNVVYHLEG